MKRTVTKIRRNPTITWWRDIERGHTEDEWQGLENNLWKTFEEVLGFETKVSEREWFDTDTERAIGKMNGACKARLGRPSRKRRTLDEQLCRERNKMYGLKKM